MASIRFGRGGDEILPLQPVKVDLYTRNLHSRQLSEPCLAVLLDFHDKIPLCVEVSLELV
ncbi:hypothetical protein QC762_0003430 [Podospora pseudocomata]|uniref:Uncharacterized protein n=1 Tax=Podospora pseudocomata TaxID=2093779 RepID=A0ABR0GT42_9PEZI|nr:hypothetical protein QC762_0003430 [Podospora pseudocomata]